MKQAVIDIGSNSMRLSVYETTEAGTFTILFKDKIMAGLAGYVEEGALSPEGITRAILGLRSFRGTLRALNIPQVAVFATASLRNIRNTAQAVAEIQRGTGFAIEVLSGEEEARLGYAGAMEELALSEGLFVDIGGASTEVVRFAHGQLSRGLSEALPGLGEKDSAQPAGGGEHEKGHPPGHPGGGGGARPPGSPPGLCGRDRPGGPEAGQTGVPPAGGHQPGLCGPAGAGERPAVLLP